DVVARRRNRLVDPMFNRGAEFPHCYDAVRVRQLHLQLAQLPLAASDLHSNCSLRGEVRDQFDLFLRKGLYAPPPNTKRSDRLVVSEQRQDEDRPNAPYDSLSFSFSHRIAFEMRGEVGDVERRLASEQPTQKAVVFQKWPRMHL